MTIFASTKIRAIGGASALALTAGMTGAAFAQAQPVPSTPTPATPPAPGNAQECIFTAATTMDPATIICLPGTDADGEAQAVDDVTVNVGEGSQVQGGIAVGNTADVVIEGDVVSSEFGVDLGDDSQISVLGLVQTGGAADTGVAAGADSSLFNTGTINTTGAGAIGADFGDGAAINNDGDIITGGAGSDAVSIGVDGIVTNSAGGRIITGGAGARGIVGGDNTEVFNAGLIQTFGADSDAIVVGAGSGIRNADGAFIFATGDAASGIVAGDNAILVNEDGAAIFTFGPNAPAVSAGAAATIQNDGIVAANGDNSSALDLGAGSRLTNGLTGEIATNGADSDAVSIAGNGEVTNAGLIQATGTGSDGLNIAGDGVVSNSGRITSIDGDGLFVDGLATITNAGGAQISSEDGNGIFLGTDGSTIDNAGVIQSRGNAALETFAANGVTVTNTGTIRGLVNASGIFGTDDFSLDNSGEVFSEAGSAVSLNDNASIINSGSIVALQNTAIVVGADITVDNSGLISAGNGGDGVLAFSGDITNSGRIEALGGGSAVDFDGTGAGEGILTNLSGAELFSDDVVVNGAFGSDDVTIRNFGLIESAGATAIDFGDGDDVYLQINDGTVIGEVLGGAGTDSFGFIVTDDTDRTFDLGVVGAGFEDIRIGSQTFDFVTNTLGTTPATGVITITGTTAQEITIVNTAIFAGSTTATVNYVTGAADGIALGVTNAGDIATTLDGEPGVGFDGSEDGAVLNNDGSISTSGMSTAAVLFGDNGTLTNTGSILSEGTNGVAVAAGDGATLTNAMGATITTTGDNGFGIVVQGDGTLTNDGVISTAGPTAQAVTISGEATVTNNGVIAAAGGRALDLGLISTVVNGADGTIGSSGGDAIRLNAAGSSVDNAGTIGTQGDANVAILGVSDTTITNSGEITTDGNDTAAIFLTTGAAITNSGSILSEGTSGVAIAIEGGDITNDAGGTITTTGDTGFGIVITGDGSVTNDGIISTTGADAQTITIGGAGTVTNSGVIGAEGGRAIDIALVGNVINNEGGVIGSSGGNAIRLNEAGSTVTNAGTIGTDGAFVAIEAANLSTITNSGTITTSSDGTATIAMGEEAVLENTGTVEATGNGSVAVAGEAGAVINNSGMGSITTTGDGSFTVVLADGGTVTNAATISAAGAASQAITSGADLQLTNSGTISGDDGRAVDVAGVATIDNLEGGVITATTTEAIRLNSGSTVTNNGSISGTTGIIGSGGDDLVANFGDLTGDDNAVALSSGSDTFQQWTGATVTGNINLGAGDDTFVLEGSSSSVSGTIDGAFDTNLAILAGIYDSDNFANFQTFQLGSTLGGTLNDLTIVGDRVTDATVIHTGIVNIGLGTSTFTTTDTITLEETGVLNVETPLDGTLIGQTLLVFQADGGITNNGATVNILDDDLLVDYALALSGTDITVTVSGVTPGVGNADPNVVTFGEVVAGAVLDGTISQANFDVLNSLTSEAEFASAASDALPSLSDGVGREIFETGSIASQMLERHLSTEGTGLWGQFVVRGADQDALSATADGYDSDQLIFTVGGDVALGDNIRIGLLASYADIEVDDQGADGSAGSVSDVDSVRLGAYLAVNFLERGFINTELSYLTGSVDAARNGAFGPISSDYDFDGIAVRSTIGYDLLEDEKITLAPTIGINAAEISFDDTVETGGFGFNVERGDAEYVEGRLGLLLGGEFSEKLDGFIQGTYIHDFTDSTRSFRLSSSQLATFTANLPLRETDRFEVNAGLSFDVSEQFAIEVGYLGDFNSGYDAHSGRASVVIAF